MEEHGDYYDEDRAKSVFEFVDTVNHIVSWNMLKQQNLIFSNNGLQELLRKNSK